MDGNTVVIFLQADAGESFGPVFAVWMAPGFFTHEMKSFLLALFLFGGLSCARAQWTPAFDMRGCAHRSEVIAEGLLDREGFFARKYTFRESRRSYDHMRLSVDDHQFQMLRKLYGNDGPYDVFAFIDAQDDQWRPVLNYAGIVALKGQDIFVAQDDLSKDELVKSPVFNRDSFYDKLAGLVGPSRYARPSSKSIAYDAALIDAALLRDYDLARKLIECGANVDARSTTGIEHAADLDRRATRGETALMAALYHCAEPPEFRNRALECVRDLLTSGADPNTADQSGVTALMIADRAGSSQAVAMLKAVGANEFDESNPKVKAALIQVDAHFLMDMLQTYWVVNSGSIMDKEISFAHLGDNLTDHWGEVPTPRTDDATGAVKDQWAVPKIYLNKGIDVLGNPYILSTRMPEVLINPKTMTELDKAVGPNFWTGFLPTK